MLATSAMAGQATFSLDEDDLDGAVTASPDFLAAGLLSFPLLAESDPFEEEEAAASLDDFSDFSGLSAGTTDAPFRLSVR
jgi:hypothetical protein